MSPNSFLQYIHDLSSSLVTKIFGLIPYGAISIDASISDIVASFKHLIVSDSVDQYYKRIEKIYGPECFISLTIRTAFDIFLHVNHFPANYEVIISAINIPDIIKIIKHHNLIPIPIDLDPQTLQPDIQQMEKAIGPKTAFVLVAQLYGRVFDLSPYIDLCHKHNLIIIEDCAESFSGPPGSPYSYIGHPQSDVVFFSFGSIKFQTAFGGGISLIRNPHLLKGMKQIHSSYKTRSRTEYLIKLLKSAFVLIWADIPFINAFLRTLFRVIGIDHRPILVSFIRGIPGDAFWKKLRQRPDSSLLASLERRLKNFNYNEFNRSHINGQFLSKLLGSRFIPGNACSFNNHWLFPVMIDNPDQLMNKMNDVGIDAYRGSTQLALVEPPPNLSNTVPRTRDMMDRLVYLPVNKNCSHYTLRTLAEKFFQSLNEIEKELPTVPLRSKL